MLNPVRQFVTRWRRAPATVVAAFVVAAALSGCWAGPYGADTANAHEQARAALSRWADAVAAAGGNGRLALVGELTGQVGDWEPAVGDNNKRALMAGLVAGAAPLPARAPPDARVQWQDGTTATVPLLSAQQAIAAIQAGTSGPCGDCTSLRVTAARLSSGPIETTRGPATAPIWEFNLQGTAVKVTRVAIADAVTVVPPPWDPNNPPAGLAIDSASGTAGGRELTVDFLGAPLPGDQPCGEDYTAEAVESDLAIVVIVTRHPHVAIGACAGVGAKRTASVQLAAPLGERAVLDVQQGLPIPIALTP
jgi:hypothetical protein